MHTRSAGSADNLLPGPMEARLTDIVVDEDRKHAKGRFLRLCCRIDGRGDLVDACLEAVNALHQRRVISDDIRIYLAMQLITFWPFEQVDPELQRLDGQRKKIYDLMGEWGDDADLDAPEEVKDAERSARRASEEWREVLQVRRLRLLGFDDVADLYSRSAEFVRRNRKGEAQLWSTIGPLLWPRPEPGSPERLRSARAAGRTVPVPRVRPPEPEDDDDWPGSRWEQELEDAIRQPDREHSRRTFSAINDHVRADPERGRDWLGAAHALEKRSVISREALVYFTDYFLGESLLEDVSADPELQRMGEQRDELEEAIEAEEDLAADHPKRLLHRSVDDAYGARALALTLQRLRNWGFGEMAELMEKKPDEYDRMRAKGRLEVAGAEEPIDWDELERGFLTQE